MLLPYLALAAWFLIVGDVIAASSLASVLTTLLSRALWLFPWGLLGIAAGTTVAQVFHLGVNRVNVPSNLSDMVSITGLSTMASVNWFSLIGTAAAAHQKLGAGGISGHNDIHKITTGR